MFIKIFFIYISNIYKYNNKDNMYIIDYNK